MATKFPHTLLIIISFILLAGVATYLLPKGEYRRIADPATNREVVVPGSYHLIDAEPLSPFDIIVSIPRGIVKASEIIALILLIGGCFHVIEKTGALREGVMILTNRFKGREEISLIFTGLLFLAGGMLEGMEEVVIPFIPVMLLLTRRLGYNVMVMVCVSYGSAVIGASFSPFNPFGAVIAQKISGVPFLSGVVFELCVMVVVFAAWITMTIRYGNRNRTVKMEDAEIATGGMTGQMKIILVVLAMAFLILIYGMLSLGWGFNEMSAEFLLVGLLAGVIGRLGLNGTCSAYVDGFREMTYAALIVGFSYGITLVLKDGKILDTIIYGLFVPMEGLSPKLFALGMMTSQSILHVVVPAYSGQAALTLPVLIPLSDLIGLSRQVCVMAFQYGAIMMNLISPTNGSLMAILALSGITYDKWVVFVGKRLLVILALGGMALIVASWMGI